MSGRALLASVIAFLVPLVSVAPAHAEGPYRNRDNKDPKDLSEGTYPIPYQKPTVAEISEILERLRANLEENSPTRVVDGRTGAEITDFALPNVDARIPDGAGEAFYPLDYTMGVVHSGMLLARDVTGDARFESYTKRQLQFIAERLPYFRAVVAKGARPAKETFGAIIQTGSLDDSGSMCAALVKARRKGVGPDLKAVIDHWSDYIAHKQFRLADGTLARQRPQPESLWADDLYMSVPALAQMGALTGERAWFDDAVKQVLQFHAHLWDAQAGLYAHGRHMNQPLNAEFYWARANGWAMMASVELLDVLPADHPGRGKVLDALKAHIRSVAKLQSGSGLWHQMLDKTDSYLETSASAIFVYSIARAINAGWIAPVTYGSVAQAGWIGVTTRVNARGQVEGTCVGTTLASDHVYYYNRPASVWATHGYGPVLLAGAEMLRLLQNPAIDVQHKLRTYHYVPKKP
jgi:unsaturated rhamnogalacturonyl hydrolase